jgi:hypothetical protein
LRHLRARELVVAVFFVEDLDAEVDAFVADCAGWSGDDFVDVAGAFAAERAAGEFAAELAGSVVVELFGDFPGGFGELGESGGSDVEVGVRIVECCGELVEGSVEELPGDDGEAWAVVAEFPGGGFRPQVCEIQR